jgi:hypothetical protein
MRTVEIQVYQANLAATLNAMREWLDREKCSVSHFRHVAGADGTLLISVGFSAPHDTHADAFQARFDDVI